MLNHSLVSLNYLIWIIFIKKTKSKPDSQPPSLQSTYCNAIPTFTHLFSFKWQACAYPFPTV